MQPQTGLAILRACFVEVKVYPGEYRGDLEQPGLVCVDTGSIQFFRLFLSSSSEPILITIVHLCTQI